jgi:LacI family transcriptional regulator
MQLNTTIKDVAEKAGVSIATVSFVLNNTPDRVISEKVRKRVIAVARRLNYHPRASAVGLAGRRSKNVTVLFYKDMSTVSNHFHSWIVEGCIKETLERKYNILFSYVTSYRGEQSLPKVVLERNTDGVILLHLISAKMIHDIQNRGIPVVAVDNTPELKNLNVVRFDAYQGGTLAAEHLIGLGHKHLGFIGGGVDRPSILMRIDGFKDTLQRHGIPFDPARMLFDCGDLTHQNAHEHAKEVLRKHKTLTALFCANDEAAAGVLRAAYDVGRRVPESLSVVGFDDIAMSEYTIPPLTTINVDKGLLGRRAVDRVIELMDDKDSPPRVEMLPVKLSLRSSTAPPANYGAR